MEIRRAIQAIPIDWEGGRRKSDYLAIFSLFDIILLFLFQEIRIVPFSSLLSQDSIFESLMMHIFIVILIIYIVHRIGHGEIIAQWIEEVLNVRSGEEVQERIADNFPVFGVSVLLLGLALIYNFEFLVANVPDQGYGLLFDGVGGVLLASDVLYESPDRVGEDTVLASDPGERRAFIYSFWGMLFLSFGFFIQLIALVPWGAMFS